MKLRPILMLVAGTIVAGTFFASPRVHAQVTKDDVAWINRCIADNKGQPGGTEEVVRKYCMCMNEEMDENETRSITAYEKANPAVRAKCDKASGWR